MSLAEAYSLAHIAQTRLNNEASRPDRHLRYVVGHLMHYESLRLRIVDIENDLASRRRSIQYHRLQHRPPPQLMLSSTPPPPTASQLNEDDTDEDIEEDDYDDALYLDGEDGDDDLSLSRFPSRASLASPPTSPTEQHLHHEPEPDLSYSPSASSDEYDEDEDTEDDSDYDDACLIAYHSQPRSRAHSRPHLRTRTPSDEGLYEGMAELGLGKDLPGAGRRSSSRGFMKMVGSIEQVESAQADRRKSSDEVGVHVEEIEVDEA